VTRPGLDNDYSGENLCFIVGAPRSGTTWAQRLVAYHPKVHTGQESYLFYWFVGPQLRKWKDELNVVDDIRGGVGLKCYLTEEEFKIALKGYAMALMEPMIGGLKQGEYFLEKTPLHAFNIMEILELFPKSKFIHIVRDSRGSVASMLQASKSWANVRLGDLNTGKAARLWLSHERQIKRAKSKIPPDQYMQLTFEEMAVSTKATLSKAWSFMGLDFNETLLDESVSRNTARQIGKTGTKIPVGGEVGKGGAEFVKEPPGFAKDPTKDSWRHDLSYPQKVQVWLVTRKMMRELGYSMRFPIPWS